jgi:hypothetical protein
MTLSMPRRVRIWAAVILAVLGISMVANTSRAHAVSLAVLVQVCDRYGDTPAPKLSHAAATLTLSCLVYKARKAAGVHYAALNTQLDTSSLGHAQGSVNAPFWDVNNGTVSHLDPGTAVPPDQNQLQSLANTQITARILGAGYCAGGSSYSVGEITYGGSGSGSTPKAAMRWWMSDPPHKAALLDPKWTNLGAAGIGGSAFNPPTPAPSGTYVIDFGTCTK